MIVAVDAAGGDFYPKNPVEGALMALEEEAALNILLLGDEEGIAAELQGKDYDHNRITIVHTPQIIGMDESPASAVKNKQQSSIVMGMGLHKAGKCDAFISAGNTGALLAASTFILGKLEGVHRPTIAAFFPTIKGFRLLVDAGANLEVKPEAAFQFAKMAKIYCREIMGIENPQVGLLNVGEEDEKGTDALKEIHQRLRSLEGFIGNIEGGDILPGKADVFLTNGLIGNMILKFGESIPDSLARMLGAAAAELKLGEQEVLLVKKVLAEAFAPFNYELVGGIPFLGVNGVSVVGHGGSSPLAIKNMIKSAAKYLQNDINGKIVAALN